MEVQLILIFATGMVTGSLGLIFALALVHGGFR
jgi:hypothetical protein